MKNLYRELKNRQQKEMDTFPLGSCFNKEQFADMMQNWGLTENDTDKIYSIGFGCYIRKSDHAAFHEMLDRHERERKKAIAADKTGDGYICQMFLHVLMRKNRRIEINTVQSYLFGKFHPRCKMFGAISVPVHFLPIQYGIACMKIQPLFAGN